MIHILLGVRRHQLGDGPGATQARAGAGLSFGVLKVDPDAAWGGTQNSNINISLFPFFAAHEI